MLEYNYYKNVREDVKDYLKDNPPEVKDFADCIECERVGNNGEARYFFEDLYNLKEELNDELFVDDGVTGNASGSYTFNSYEAKEYVLSGGSQILKDAVDEGYLTAENFTNYFLNEYWETLDVICRCYALGVAIDEAVEEWADYYAENYQDYLKELYEEYNDWT